MYLFLALIFSLEEHSLISTSVKRLHELTKYRTYYDLFNLPENCNFKDLRRAYGKLLRSETPIDANLSKSQTDSILTEGFNMLKDRKEAYDKFLNSTYTTELIKESSIISILSGLLFIVFIVIAIDFTYTFSKYLIKNKENNKYTEFSVKEMQMFKIFGNNKKEAAKEKKKKKKH
ncbi:hypothetical protein SLOPH_1885 [Spraguea lophii 42_110]|uniref:J domain-containing protein n=1 Tax=Spraguea lophii (strain 42_110) TaxID=1358809 RepID=S7WDG3_SPRLO|nr:hypothetical protein SLOPH_1885 [Spraguea lophii 42_110]